jgi:hypothetical protein
MSSEFQSDVFLSHSAKDKAVVRVSSLSASIGERAGVRCRSLQLAERGIDFAQVAAQAGQPDADETKAKGQRLNAKTTVARTRIWLTSAFSLQPSALFL